MGATATKLDTGNHAILDDDGRPVDVVDPLTGRKAVAEFADKDQADAAAKVLDSDADRRSSTGSSSSKKKGSGGSGSSRKSSRSRSAGS